MRRKKRSKDELRGASDCLHYEIWMLTTLARAQSTGIAGNSPLNNALLESFVIHVRVLLDFLYAERPRSDDVIAEDFLPCPDEWSSIRPPKTELLETIRRRVGKEAAHLTYARLDVTPETKGWEFLAIAEDISRAFNQFMQVVPKELLGSRWERMKSIWAGAGEEDSDQPPAAAA